MPHATRRQPPRRRSRTVTAFLTLATIATALPAQVSTVIPAGFAGAGSSASGSIWRAGPNRVQTIYDSTTFTSQGFTAPLLVQRLRWRLADGLTGAAVTYPNVEIWLGDSATDHLTPSTTFASNRSGNHTAVYTGPITVTPAAGTAPNTYVIDVLLTTPFLYQPSLGADLLVEIVIQAPPSPATGSTISTSSSVATHRANSVRSIGSTTALSGSTSPFAAVLKLEGTSTAPIEPVKINELAYDAAPSNGGTDNEEYIELYNPSTTTGVDLTGWSLRFTGASGGTATWNLPSQTIPSGPTGGFRLFGSPGMAGANATFPSNDFLRNDHAGIELIDAYGRVVDAVAFEAFASAWASSPAEQKGIFAPFVTESTSAPETVAVSWARVLDGHDSTESVDGYNALDFHLRRQSRGTTNSFAAGIYPYLEDCNQLSANQVVVEWGGSKLLARASSPPTPSPDTGLAIRFGTPPTGGGAAYMLEYRAERRISLDAYFYFDLAAPGATNSWSIGARGTTDPEYNFPDLAGGNGDNGDIGLCWTYVATSTTGTLYLLDRRDGGKNGQELAKYSISAPGWHRLRLESNGNRGVAYFGGTVGEFDVPRIEAVIDDTRGNLWVGVRSTQPGFALYADGLRVQVDEIVSDGIGEGCAGNCPRINPRAHRLEPDATIGELGLPTNPNGNYRLQFTPNTGTNSGTNTSYVTKGVRMFTQRLSLPTTATTTVSTMVTLRNANDGSVLASGTLTVDPDAVENEAAWWSYTFPPTTVSFDVFVDIGHTGELLLPIVDQIRDGSGETGSPTLFPANLTSPPTITAGWAVTLICVGMTGESTGDADADAPVGDTTNFKMDHGSANDLTIKLFGLVPGPIDLAPFGAPGCPLQMGSIAATIPMVTSARGTAGYVLTVPNVPGLVGLQIRSQWASLDLGLNALGFALSSAIRVTLR